MMRILFVVHHFPPDVNSTGLLMARVAKALSSTGDSVSVLTTFPHYEGFRVWPEYRRKLRARSFEDGVDVTRVYSFTSGAKGMIPRLFNYVTFNISAILAGLFMRGFDVVFCTNGSFFSGFTGHLLSRIKGARCIYNLQDLYPEVPVAQGQLTSRSAIRILERIEKWMYHHADRLSVITPSFKDNLELKGVPPEKITVVPNFVDTGFIRPLPRSNAFSSDNDLEGRFVVSHAGNVGYVYDLESLLRAAALLEGSHPELLVLIIGDGVARPGLERLARELASGNVRFLPFQPYDDLPYLRASSDVSVSLYRSGSGDFSMPSKVYEIMASGRPLLASADEDSDIAELIRSTQCGLVVPPEDPASLADAIAELHGDPRASERMGMRGRMAAEARYSQDAVVAQYRELFGSLVDKGRS